jgi:hypothetical protein
MPTEIQKVEQCAWCKQPIQGHPWTVSIWVFKADLCQQCGTLAYQGMSLIAAGLNGDKKKVSNG